MKIDTLKSVRQPVQKLPNESSSLYKQYRRHGLSREVLENSHEDLFTVAFIYNKLFDIEELISRMASTEITIQSYNVIKQYSVLLEQGAINRIFNSPNRLLAVLKGEVYREKGMELDSYDPYFIIGYCSEGNSLLSNFEDTFDRVITQSLDILDVLDDFGFLTDTDDVCYSEYRAAFAITKHIDRCLDHLATQGILHKIVHLMDFTQLAGQAMSIAGICKDEKSLPSAIDKLSDVDDETFFAVISLVIENFSVLVKIKKMTMERIASTEVAWPGVIDFFHSCIYHSLIDSDQSFIKDHCVRLGFNPDEYMAMIDHPETVVDSDILARIRNAVTLRDEIRLFPMFQYYCKTSSPILDDILDLPERFFSYGLHFVCGETARHLETFNNNLLNERLRRSSSEKISREVLVRYLVKRRQLFKIDWTGYEHYMDDQYKIMYAMYDLEWASSHVPVLTSIGMPYGLYRCLKNSYSHCVEGIAVPTDIDKLVTDIAASSAAETERLQDNNLSTGPIVCSFQMKAGNNPVKRVRVEKSDQNIANVPQKIYDEMKNEIPNCSQFISQIPDGHEYLGIIKMLFGWTSKTKLFAVFSEFFTDSVLYFEVPYGQIREIVHAVMERQKPANLVARLAQSLVLDDIPALIDDFPHTQQIVDGVSTRKDYTGLVQSLVHLESVDRIVVGAKLFSTLQDPPFNIDHLLASTLDCIIIEAVKQLKGAANDELLEILFSRGTTDELAAEICKRLDRSQLSQKDLQRIYSLFYISPVNFIKFEIYKHGFCLDEHISIDLIRSLSTVFSEDLFVSIVNILSGFQLTPACYEQMIASLDTRNDLYKSWVLETLDTENITLPFFIKICWFVCNEDDLVAVAKALRILKRGRCFDIVNKWARVKKLNRLTRRVYPLCTFEPEFYRGLFDGITDEEEKRMLNDVYMFGFL